MRFTRAIVRPPATTFAEGITSSRLGTPDLALALDQHDAYCRTLERLGLSLTRLPPDPEFPDSTFVEDAAIVTSRGATLTRPGAESRVGEISSVGRALERWFPDLDGIVCAWDGRRRGRLRDRRSLLHRPLGAHQLGRGSPARGVACAAWLSVERDRDPRNAQPAASQDRAFLARRTTAARGRRARRARGARRMGGRSRVGG